MGGPSLNRRTRPRAQIGAHSAPAVLELAGATVRRRPQPFASVGGIKYSVTEGRTPELGADSAFHFFPRQARSRILREVRLPA
jgi:hypothetical protein